MENNLILEMIKYYEGDPKRIQHFIKVYTFARLIGEKENLPLEQLKILMAAAIVHDIGIKKAEEIYGYNNGKLQEKYGPEIALPLLKSIGYTQNQCDRICMLIAHHHTYTGIDDIDYRILVEADFLVNLYEDNAKENAVKAAYNKIFRTATGKELCRNIFKIEE